MTSRSGAVKAAALLAAVFVVVRIAYRVLFNGAEGDGAVLWTLPELRLPAPFAHVRLLGTVTADGLGDAALSALPIALVILAFGLLAAFVDMPRLLARGAHNRRLGGICRTLAIAWATVPSLADGVRAARLAQRLRDERNAVRLLAPVLERAIERATALAAALELRGYAARGAERPRADADPVLLDDVRAGFGDVQLLEVEALALPVGAVVAVSGTTGSGKSTLLRALAGLHTQLDGGWMTGRAIVTGADRVVTPPRDTARDVGVVLQDPRQAFAAAVVADEIGLALDLRHAPDREARVAAVADRVGIAALLGRPVRGLSAGEATLVAIAAAIVDDPALLLVDEPLADLDPQARARIVALLDALAHDDGLCVVVAEHRMAELAPIADVALRVVPSAQRRIGGLSSAMDPHDPADDAVSEGSGSCVVQIAVAAESAQRRTDDHPSAVLPQDAAERHVRDGSGSCVVQVRHVTVRRGTHLAVADASLELRGGEVLVLAGHNGAGKSSLVEAIAVGAEGVASAGPVALVPDASDDLFVRDSVAAECRASDRRFRPGTPTADRLAAFLGLDAAGEEFGAILRSHPRDLSAGQRRCLAIALQTARRPAALLIDEPTRGLDPAARALVARVVRAEAAEGVAVLLATHDADLATAVADRRLWMHEGTLGGEPARSHAARSSSERGTSESRRVSSLPPRRRADAGGVSTRLARSTNEGGELTRSSPPRRALLLALANLAAAAAFLWPLFASAVPSQAQAAVPYIALAVAPLAALVLIALLDDSVRSAHVLAHLAVLGAVGAAIRIAGTGVGGVEALFVLLVLAGRALGARFGLLLGAVAIGLSAMLWGGVGPWLPFQMFACGWVAAGAGLLPRGIRGRAEIAMLAVYGVAASYLFGLLMNMWFWPFAVGSGTGASYAPGAPLGENLASFLVYSLATSTLSWDTLRAITTVVGLAIVGTACLRALRRAKPVTAPAAAPASGPVRPRSTSLPGGGTRTRPSTARDAAAAPR